MACCSTGCAATFSSAIRNVIREPLTYSTLRTSGVRPGALCRCRSSATCRSRISRRSMSQPAAMSPPQHSSHAPRNMSAMPPGARTVREVLTPMNTSTAAQLQMADQAQREACNFHVGRLASLHLRKECAHSSSNITPLKHAENKSRKFTYLSLAVHLPRARAQ